MRAFMCVVYYVWWCCIVLYYSISHIATIMVQCCSVLFHIAALSSCSWLGARAGDPHCGAANRNMLQSFRTLSPFLPTPHFPLFLYPQPTTPHFPRFSPLPPTYCCPKLQRRCFLRANMRLRFIQLFMWDIAGKKWIDSYTSITYSALKWSSEMCFRKSSWELQFEDQGCIRLQRPGGIVVNTRVTNQLNMFPFQYLFFLLSSLF